MSRISIFIGFTPYHAYAASRIIAQLDGRIYCAFTKSWPVTDKKYVRIGLPARWSFPGAAALSFLCFAIFVRGLFARGSEFDVYMPHPGHILSNYLFFVPAPQKKIYLYEDGLLNYYDAVVVNSFVGKTKRFLAYIGGLRYRDYAGHLAGYDAGRYDGAFLTMPDQAVRKDRLGALHRLEYEIRKIPLNSKTILFLDQDVSSRVSHETRQACVATMLEHFPPDVYAYYYKPHHDHGSRFVESMQCLVPELRALPAEMLIDQLRPSHAISFFSSALMNIKTCWPEIECVSLAALYVPVTRDGKSCSLRDIFEERDVLCL